MTGTRFLQSRQTASLVATADPATPQTRIFNLHPDGERLAASVATGPQAEEKFDHVIFIFNFFDELRRIAPASKK